MNRPPTTENPSKGPLVSQLSREVVQLHSRHLGRGPTKARSYIEDDYALCVLEENFTAVERTLIESGSGSHVRETRERFLDAVGSDLEHIVEAITGRKVSVFLSQIDIDADLAVEVFIFDRRDDHARSAPG